MAGQPQKQRIDALERSHHDLHSKLDQLLGVREPRSPVLLDASGREVVPSVAPPVQMPSSDNTAEMLRVLLPHLTRQQVAPVATVAPSTDWTAILTTILPILLTRLLDRPDPIEQLQALKELSEGDSDGTADQMMMMAMPSILKRLNGGGGAGDGESDNAGMAEVVQQALAGLDPAILRTLVAGQAQATSGVGAT